MDRIFRKTTTVFNVVTVAREEPHAYGPKGELLYTLEDIEDNSDNIKSAGSDSRGQVSCV